MTMPTNTNGDHTCWWVLTVKVPSVWADDASASLIAAGALGVQMSDPESLNTLPAHVLLNASYQVLATSQTIQSAEVVADLIQNASDALLELGLSISPQQITVKRQQENNWADAWKKYFKPLKMGRRLWIVPSWETSFLCPKDGIKLTLDPGMAFGTGQHATTAMCLKAIEQHVETLKLNHITPANMLDLGCGSGILAIAGAKLGFQQVLAVDTDPVATQVTQQNVQINQVNVQVQVGDIDICHGPFALIVANILAQPLIDMANLVIQRLQSGSTLILSGLLHEQSNDVLLAYNQAADKAQVHLQHTQRWTHGQWSALAFVVQ